MSDSDLEQYFAALREKADLLYSYDDVVAAIDTMAAQISADYEGEEPVLVLTVMQGALVTSGHLLPRLQCIVRHDYVHTRRYQDDLIGGELEFLTDLSPSIAGARVLLVDDIIDAGVTLQALSNACISEGALDVRTAVLLDKENNRSAEGLPKADYVGLTVPNRYVFGFGLDYRSYCRNWKGIFAIDE